MRNSGQWWTTAWSPIRVKGGGWNCTKISAGCKNCWAEAMNIRFGNGNHFSGKYFTGIENPEFEVDQRILEQPLHWKKPQVIAAQWMGDIAHEKINSDLFLKIFMIIRRCQQHTFLMLTKRVIRLQGLIEWVKPAEALADRSLKIKELPENFWIGVSICTQQEADEKIPILLQTPAAHRFVNLGPMLEDIDLTRLKFSHITCYNSLKGEILEPGSVISGYGINKLDWVCLECESGPRRRPMKLEWVRSIADQCEAAGVPLFVKQLTIDGKVSRDPLEWPQDLRRRELPWRLLPSTIALVGGE